MTRTQHYCHPTRAFPVYCLEWPEDRVVLLGGGGGASRSGIANKFKLAKVSPDGRRFEPLSEIVLSNEEDAPMTLALDRSASDVLHPNLRSHIQSSQLVTGINGSQAEIEAGRNPNVRVFSYKDNELSPVRSEQTITAPWSDDYPYQKLTAVSGDSAYVAVGGTDNKVAVLSLPSLEIVIPPFVTEGGDVVDLSWGGPDGLWLAVTTAQKVDIYALVPREKLPALEVLGSIPAPEDTTTLSFRAARFAPERTPTPAILAVLNSAPSRKDRRAPRKAYVAKFDAVEEVEAKEGDDKTEAAKEEGAKVATATAATRPNVEWTLATKREVARKPITVFDVSADGRLVAFGASDLCIGMMDAKTLAPLLKILQAHSFPPTALKFNPSGTLLASASADNTIRTVVVPASFGSAPSSLVVILFITLLVLIIAMFLRK